MDDGIRFVQWPQSRYLIRVAPDAPRIVADIILEIPSTDNISVLSDFADAVCAMPPDQAVRLTDKAMTWASGPYAGLMLLSEGMGRVIGHLAEGGYPVESLGLAKVVLALKSPLEHGLGARPEANLGDWEFKEILRLRVPALVRSSGVDAVIFLCDLLDDAVDIYRGPSEEGEDVQPIREDYSRIWRPNISVSSYPGNEDLQESLVSAVRDAALQIVRDHPELIDDVVAELQKRRWTVFWRISLYVLREAGANGLPLACIHLNNPQLANEHGVESEYLELLRTAFGAMTSDCQHQLLELIDAGPDISDLIDDVDEDWYIRRWRWQRLAAIKIDLPTDRLDEWDQLSVDFGTDLELRREGIVTWSGRPDAIGVDRLSVMPLVEIVELIGGFESGDGFRRPTADDFARELTQAVATDPQRFAAEVPVFEDVSLVYKAGLIAGFRTAAEAGREFDWSPVLTLCQNALSEAGPLPDQESRSARREAVGLLQSGLAPKGIEIPFAFRSEVWEILTVLIEDPDPSSELEADDPGGGYARAINTIRGRAVEAAIYYGIWFYRHTRPEGTGEYTFNLDEAPELRDALERHCDDSVDSSPVVRSVYGVFLPTLYGLDKDWVTDNLGKILPTGEANFRLRQAAWEGYVGYARLNLSMLDLLRDEYARSIELVDSTALEEHPKPDEQIGTHLVIFYWHGRLALNDPMMVRFFEVAADEVRAQVLASMGQDLRKDHEPLPADLTARLKELWEWRIEEARAGTGREYNSEMAAFGWTFSSGELGDSWLLSQLEATLQICGRTAIDHQVVEHLASLAVQYPVETVRCLGMLVDGAEEGWQIHHWASNMESVLAAALRSGDDEATQPATALIHRLGANGFLRFKSLLDEC